MKFRLLISSFMLVCSQAHAQIDPQFVKMILENELADTIRTGKAGEMVTGRGQLKGEISRLEKEVKDCAGRCKNSKELNRALANARLQQGAFDAVLSSMAETRQISPLTMYKSTGLIYVPESYRNLPPLCIALFQKQLKCVFDTGIRDGSGEPCTKTYIASNACQTRDPGKLVEALKAF